MHSALAARLLAIVLIAFTSVTGAADLERQESSAVAAPKHVEFAGGDGSGCERAVVIRGSKGSRDIVASEIAWLGAHHPGYKFRDNSVETRGRRTFEEITIETTSGEKKVVCFDITEGFGHF